MKTLHAKMESDLNGNKAAVSVAREKFRSWTKMFCSKSKRKVNPNDHKNRCCKTLSKIRSMKKKRKKADLEITEREKISSLHNSETCKENRVCKDISKSSIDSNYTNLLLPYRASYSWSKSEADNSRKGGNSENFWTDSSLININNCPADCHFDEHSIDSAANGVGDKNGWTIFRASMHHSGYAAKSNNVVGIDSGYGPSMHDSDFAQSYLMIKDSLLPHQRDNLDRRNYYDASKGKSNPSKSEQLPVESTELIEQNTNIADQRYVIEDTLRRIRQMDISGSSGEVGLNSQCSQFVNGSYNIPAVSRGGEMTEKLCRKSIKSEPSCKHKANSQKESNNAEIRDHATISLSRSDSVISVRNNNIPVTGLEIVLLAKSPFSTSDGYPSKISNIPESLYGRRSEQLRGIRFTPDRRHAKESFVFFLTGKRPKVPGFRCTGSPANVRTMDLSSEQLLLDYSDHFEDSGEIMKTSKQEIIEFNPRIADVWREERKNEENRVSEINCSNFFQE